MSEVHKSSIGDHVYLIKKSIIRVSKKFNGFK